MDKKPTVYDVAKAAGVSIATVSRAIHSPKSVKKSTREAINRSISALGYVPSGSAMGLAANKTNTIGLFLPSIDELEQLSDFSLNSTDDARVVRDVDEIQRPRPDSLYFDEVLRGCELESWHTGLSLMVNIGFGHTEDDLMGLMEGMFGKVDGLILMARSMPDRIIEILRHRMPIVMIASSPSNLEGEFDLVRVSNRKGVMELVKHLFETHGVTDFAYLAGSDDSPDNKKRYEGFYEGLSTCGFNPAAVPIYYGQFSQTVAKSITSGLIKHGTLPRALVCANDQMALGALSALKEANVRVPEDVIVTGFDDIEESETCEPRLTTVHQPMLDLGRAAVSTLVKRMQNPDIPPISTELPVTVLLRQSCEG